MREIRLAVGHPEEAGRAAVAARLRGVVVESHADGCDAALFVGLTDRAAVERSLAAKVHVLLVAQPCPGGEVIESLHQSAQKSGAQFCVVNPDRYLPSRQLIRKQLGGPLGEAGLLRLHRWEPANGTPELGGLPEPLVRDFDLTLWLVGREPDQVFAVEPKPGLLAGRYLQVHMGFPHGGMALLDYAGRLPPGDGYSSLSVIASTGAAYADDHQNAQLLYRGGSPQAIRTEERVGTLAAVAQEFVDALKEGRQLSADTESWREVFAVAEAVQKSLASGQAVTPEGH